MIDRGKEGREKLRKIDTVSKNAINERREYSRLYHYFNRELAEMKANNGLMKIGNKVTTREIKVIKGEERDNESIEGQD